jgi:FlaG/FlaF family flagellin (archaellin)
MNRAKILVGCVLLCGLLLVGCSGDEDDEPGSGTPPAALVGTWVFESVTVNGAPQALGDVLDWQAGTVAASMSIASNGFAISEVDSAGQETHYEAGFVYVDGNEMELNILAPGGIIEETISGTYTLSGDTLIFTTVEEGDTIAITLTLMAGTGGTGGTGGTAGTANCDAYCDTVVRCSPSSDPVECLNSCVARAEGALSRSADCFDARSDLNGCLAGLGCEQAMNRPCEAERDAELAACS